jgi:hypothetical protein
MLTWGKGWGNRELVLDGATVGYFETGTFRERATVVLGSESWDFHRMPGGAIEGLGPVGAPAQHRLWATKMSMWRYTWDVVTPVARYGVALRGIFGGAFEVTRGGYLIGEAQSVSIFSNRYSLALPPDVPLPDQAFLLWVVEASARRRSNQASTSS